MGTVGWAVGVTLPRPVLFRLTCTNFAMMSMRDAMAAISLALSWVTEETDFFTVVLTNDANLF